jgi:hypothetical protein
LQEKKITFKPPIKPDENRSRNGAAAWRAFKEVTTNFLGNLGAENNESFLEEILIARKFLGRRTLTRTSGTPAYWISADGHR